MTDERGLLDKEIARLVRAMIENLNKASVPLLAEQNYISPELDPKYEVVIMVRFLPKREHP